MIQTLDGEVDYNKLLWAFNTKETLHMPLHMGNLAPVIFLL